MIKILSGGIQTLIEDPVGRQGYMDLGIAHSGTMDHYAARAANLIAGNDLNDALIEITAGLFAVEAEAETVLVVTGGAFGPTINGNPMPMWEAVHIKKGDVIRSGNCGSDTRGFRQYWAFSGGIDVPMYLGSRSTAVYGGFGGFEGRALKKGDVLKLHTGKQSPQILAGRTLKPELIPDYERTWVLRAIPGPNAAPDYFTEETMDKYFSETFKTQRHADRSGIRLSGPKPEFSELRLSGGGHPSNVMDQGYPGPGCVNMSGETPIMFPREAPTSGGFACILSIIHADQWMMGQITPGTDSVRFEYCTPETAVDARRAQDALFTESAIVKTK